MVKTNRIFKENYSLRPSVIFDKGWKLITIGNNDGTGNCTMGIIVDESENYTTITGVDGESIVFGSHEEAQNFVDGNSPFNVNAFFRNELLALAYGDKILEYTYEDKKILATWNQEKSETCFFEIGEYKDFDSYVKMNELEGKTVKEAISIIQDWLDEAYDDYIRGYSDSYFNMYNRECSSCGGGGCVYCEPNRFL